MKNNQFKKILRQYISTECEISDLQSVAIDESTNSRMIYIYTLDWKCAGIFSCWFTKDNLHIKFTADLSKPIAQTVGNEICCNYTQFNKIIKLVENAFEIMDKEN